MKKVNLILCCCLLVTTLWAQRSYRCFDSDDNVKLKISVEYLNDLPISVKYKGQSASIPLSLIKGSQKTIEGFSTIEESFNEMLNGQINGKYIFTHSGIWDYIVYIRKDGAQFNFTINHDESLNPSGDGYREAPCY
jgi:hypothetical protein